MNPYAPQRITEGQKVKWPITHNERKGGWEKNINSKRSRKTKLKIKKWIDTDVKIDLIQ